MYRRFSFILLAASLATAIGCGYVKQSYLGSFVESEKQNLPKRLFSNLEAIDVESGDSELIYICKAKGVEDELTKQGQRKTQMSLQDYVRTNKEKLKDLSANKIKLTIVMRGNDESELYRLTVNPWEF